MMTLHVLLSNDLGHITLACNDLQHKNKKKWKYINLKYTTDIYRLFSKPENSQRTSKRVHGIFHKITSNAW
jgi:hypothetical protein